MYVKIKKRTLVILSLLAFVLVLSLAGAVLCLDRMRTRAEQDTKNETAAGWRLSVAELSAALSDLETDLQKGLYSSGEYQAVSWAARVFAEAGAARTALETLPIYDLRLQGTETFLNQVGEFTLEMARKQVRGEDLTLQEEESLKTLALRSRQLADEVIALAEKIADENPDYQTMQQMLLPSEEGQDKTEFESLEEIFSGDEPLIYDGDFSAWHTTRTSSWLNTFPTAADGVLKRAAAEALGLAEGDLTETGRYDTPFPFAEFSAGEQAVAVTLGGGKIYGFDRTRTVSESKLTVEDAAAKGTKGLADLGYPNMEAIAWNRAENTVSVTYAARQNGVLVYADRVTATVALDNGELLTVNGVEYLLSHKPDRSSETTLSATEAATVLREGLSVVDTDLVSLPGGDGSEKLCWQLTVTDGTEEEVLVFVNAHTKVEEDILIVLRGEDFRKAE
ncbi:MAG: germination protein YpeB [Clostridia bacterium]|nr:germination protein YpeB [Clostridia bacterium]